MSNTPSPEIAPYATCVAWHDPDKPDFTFENHGSILLLHSNTDAAEEWIEENVSAEPWQYMGNALAIELRYAAHLAAGMNNDGLTFDCWTPSLYPK